VKVTQVVEDTSRIWGVDKTEIVGNMLEVSPVGSDTASSFCNWGVTVRNLLIPELAVCFGGWHLNINPTLMGNLIAPIILPKYLVFLWYLSIHSVILKPWNSAHPLENVNKSYDSCALFFYCDGSHHRSKNRG
jgi:hypothetical protein